MGTQLIYDPTSLKTNVSADISRYVIITTVGRILTVSIPILPLGDSANITYNLIVQTTASVGLLVYPTTANATFAGAPPGQPARSHF